MDTHMRKDTKLSNRLLTIEGTQAEEEEGGAPSRSTHIATIARRGSPQAWPLLTLLLTLLLLLPPIIHPSGL